MTASELQAELNRLIDMAQSSKERAIESDNDHDWNQYNAWLDGIAMFVIAHRDEISITAKGDEAQHE